MNDAREVALLPTTRLESVKRAVVEIVAERLPPIATWSAPKRLGFRFLFLYLAVSFLPTPLDAVPGVSTIAAPYETAWRVVQLWVGRHLFRLSEIATEKNGSGDTTFAWLRAFCFVAIALVGTAVWSVVAKREREHARLAAALRLWLRYLLASALVMYGFSKLFGTQFRPPSPDDLYERYGRSTPMHLLWMFMGSSSAYSIFGGAAEMVGALLLLWRRTATLGALLLAGVLTNVVVLNLCYDVPVKLYSSQLLLMAVVIAAPDMGRLANVLVMRRATDAPPASMQRVRWAARTRLGVKLAFIGLMLFGKTTRAIESWRKWGTGAPQPALSGIYDVESFTRNGVEVPPLATDETRWRTVVFNPYSWASFYDVDGRKRGFRETYDEPRSTVTLHGESWGTFTLTYSRPDADHLTLEGDVDGAPIVARTKRASSERFPLVSRGFHWVSEHPANW